MREATPPELQYVVTDKFESIVLYENKAVTATAIAAGTNTYKVSMTVNTAKRKADGAGNETQVALNDLIESACFPGPRSI